MITIGYVSINNPFIDRNAWSGTIYKVREGIERAGYEVRWVKITPPKYLGKVLKLLLKIMYGSTMHHPLLFRLLAKHTDWKVASECDILFFCGNAQIMKYAPIKKEYIYYTDACFHQMIDYYWYNIHPRLIRLADREEKYAIQNATINLRSSKWARECAVNYYGGSDDRNFVLEFGANLDEKDIIESQIYKSGELRILFSGVDWERKGGDIAIETVKILRDKYNIDAKITIVGIRKLPDAYLNLSYVNNLGFLNKNNPDEYDFYVNTIKESHMLLLPTKAECAGIIFSEAAAYGLPIFTHDTGGIGNYVINGVNGYRLPMGSTGEDFADIICQTLVNSELCNIHHRAIDLYKKCLNWNSWSDKFKDIVSQCYK